MNSLVYLEKAINFKRSYGDDPFLEETIKQALNVVIEQDRNAVALPGGESIVAALAKVSTSAALHWLDIRGRGAWTPTSRHSFPLIAVLKSNGGWGNSHQVSHAYLKEDALETLVESGLRHGMPLCQDQATADFMSSPANKEAIDAQADILRHLLSLNRYSLPTQSSDQLWGAFRAGGGALVFNGDLQGMQLAESEIITPQTQVWFANGKAFSLAPWVDHWRRQGGCQYASEANASIVPWLENSGEDMTAENAILFISKINRDIERSKSGQEAWSLLCQKFANFKDAWHVEEDGVLLWQKMLRKTPAALQAAIATPPPTGLSQKSASGHGIWDAIGPHWSGEFSPSSMRRLHAKTKIETRIRFTHPWHENGLGLARATMADHPRGWVGKPSPKQDRWAVEMLVYLCSSLGQEEKTATQTYALLMEDERHRASLGPVARGVLGVINHLHEQGLLDECAGDFKPLEQEGGRRWAAFVLRTMPKKIKKLDIASGNTDKMGAILAFVQNQALQDKTPVSLPKQAPRPRRM